MSEMPSPFELRRETAIRSTPSGIPEIPAEIAPIPEGTEDAVDAALAELFAGYAERAVALAAELEVARIRAHFDAVLAELRARDVSRLAPEAREAREAHIARLEAYRDAGVFPKNTRFSTFEPFFIDDVGTRCAMAHLVESSGGGDYVARVAGEKNFARIKELAADPELGPPLLAWLEQNGLSVEEAARIQPTYCTASASACFCEGSGPGTAAEVEVTERRQVPDPDSDAGAQETAVIAVVRALHGEPSSLAVGDEVEVSRRNFSGAPDFAVGTQLVVKLEGDEALVSSASVVQDGQVRCDTSSPKLHSESWAPEASEVSLSKDEAIQALLAADCRGFLEEKDERFTASECGGGCSFAAPGLGGAGLGAAGTLPLLALLLAWKLRRRPRGQS